MPHPLARVTAVLSCLALTLAAVPAYAHEERPAQFPAGTGSVPALRAGYAEALRGRYRWHEFGDVHLLLPGRRPGEGVEVTPLDG